MTDETHKHTSGEATEGPLNSPVRFSSTDVHRRIRHGATRTTALATLLAVSLFVSGCEDKKSSSDEDETSKTSSKKKSKKKKKKKNKSGGLSKERCEKATDRAFDMMVADNKMSSVERMGAKAGTVRGCEIDPDNANRKSYIDCLEKAQDSATVGSCKDTWEKSQGIKPTKKKSKCNPGDPLCGTL